MVDYHQRLVSALAATGYPVYFEKFDTTKTYPCITYMEIANSDTLVGDTLSYSSIAYQLKCWAGKLSDAQAMALAVDATLKPLGFRRAFVADTVDAQFTVKIMRYNGTGYED